MLDTVENGYTLFHITIGSRGALRKCHVTTWPPRSRDTFTLRRTVASATVHRKAKRIYKKQDLLSMLGSHVISKKKQFTRQPRFVSRFSYRLRTCKYTEVYGPRITSLFVSCVSVCECACAVVMQSCVMCAFSLSVLFVNDRRQASAPSETKCVSRST